MDQERAVKKLRFNVEQGHISLEDALSQAYAAGFDGKVKVNGCEKAVVQMDKDHNDMMEFSSITLAAKKLKVSRWTIIDSCRLDRLTRKGYYFRYADKEE